VAGREPEPFVEAVRLGARPVAGELDEPAATALRLLDGPADERGAVAAAPAPRVDVHRLELCPPRAPASEVRRHRELQRPDRRPVVVVEAGQQVRGVGVDRGERRA
jgi:hypothetical protein